MMDGEKALTIGFGIVGGTAFIAVFVVLVRLFYSGALGSLFLLLALLCVAFPASGLAFPMPI
jgi:hypothetical protein